MTTPFVSSVDGPRITVNDFLKDPLRIPTLVIDMLDQGFIADAVLRNAGGNPGVVKYYEHTPLYADGTARVRAEFGEVPVYTTSRGVPKSAFSEERPMSLVVSDEMRRRNDVDAVNVALTQIRNSMVQTWDDVFFDFVLTHPGVYNVTGADFSNEATDIRKTLMQAAYHIKTSKDDNGSTLGFKADTIIINEQTEFELFAQKDFNTVYLGGNIADENLRYTGKLPNKLLGFDVLVSPRVPEDKLIVMQRGRAGFISDELPLQATALYRDEPRKSWRSDIQRASAVGLDQPKCITVVSGVNGTAPVAA
jgi:hypothetical protein